MPQYGAHIILIFPIRLTFIFIFKLFGNVIFIFNMMVGGLLNLVVGTGTGPRPACQNYPRKESTKIYKALETVKTISKLCIPDDDHQNYRESCQVLHVVGPGPRGDLSSFA